MPTSVLTDIYNELHVPDFKKAKSFYSKLGFRIVWEQKPKQRLGYLVMKRGKSILCFYCGNKCVYEHSYFKKFSRKTIRGYGVEIVIPTEKIGLLYKKVLKCLGKKSVACPLETKYWGKKDFRMVDPFGYYLRFTEPFNILKK
jgi:lactoylglutathione lyase